MTRRDYVLIADSFRKVVEVSWSHQSIVDVVEAMARQMAKDLKADNPAFDVDRFIKACGIGDQV